MKRFKPDPGNPPRFTADDQQAFSALTPEEIESNAESDPDNPPSTEDELQRIRSARLVQAVRRARGMSQSEFSKTYGIGIARLKDWEQGRFTPDAMARAYLDTIRYEPDAVARALRKASEEEHHRG